MGAVYSLFSLSDRVLSVFSVVFDKFCMPINELIPVISGSLVEKVYNKVFDLVGYDFSFNNSILDFILGPGFWFIIYFTFVKWLLDIVL